MILRFLILLFTLLLSIHSNCQTEAEWLIEMNTTNGSFETIGEPIEGVELIYLDIQCKDETNGQYIFLKKSNSKSFVTVDITTAEIVDETLHPIQDLPSTWGMHCLENCDTLLIVCKDNLTGRNYVALFDRVDGTELILLGDSLPNDFPQFLGISITKDAFDSVNNLLYLYSDYVTTLRVMDVQTGEIINSFPLNHDIMNMAFDEIDSKLYALEYTDQWLYRLLVFDHTLGSFIPVGEEFAPEAPFSNNITTTIDGNNQRMLITQNSANSGSFIRSIDLNTGELLTDIQTMPGNPGGGLYGGPNTVNGMYFNSTDQLIALHWGEGSVISSTEVYSTKQNIVYISPNPNNGSFTLKMEGYKFDMFDLTIVNLQGQVVYEKHDLQKNHPLVNVLPSGFYIANIISPNSTLYGRVPFVVD